jgi:hypothetical protein
MRLVNIFFSICMVWFLPRLSIAQLSIQISSRQEIYNRMQFPSDAVSATLKQDATMLRTFLSTSDRTSIYTGSLGFPWQVSTVHLHKDFYDTFTRDNNYALQHTAEYVYDFGTNRYHAITNGADRINLFLKNIYKISSRELLGFLHVEYTFQNGTDPYPAYYAIGLSYSSDNGSHWRFCGDIIRTYNTAADVRCNIGGAPYICKGDTFYVYFNEADSAFHNFPSVACAPRKDVITAAKAGHVVPWRKYNGNGSWAAEACAAVLHGRPGLGAEIISRPYLSSSPAVTLDTHGDAAYCSALKKFLLLIKAGWSLFLLESSDGLAWNNPTLVAINDSDPHGKLPSYPYFASLSGDASDDCSVVGKNFTIFYLNMLYPPIWPDCVDPSNAHTPCKPCTTGTPPPCITPPFSCRSSPVYIGNGCGYNYPGDCSGGWRKDGTDFSLWQIKVSTESPAKGK